MTSSNGSQNLRNLAYPGKQALLPPKSPFTSGPTFNTDFAATSLIGSKAVQNRGEGNINHHRTSSESFLIEEQPSWLDDLLNEPETPVRKGGHRRSSSDSFAYADVTVGFDVDYALWDAGRYSNNNFSGHVGGHKEFNYHKGQNSAYYPLVHLPKQKNRTWDLLPNSTARTNSSIGLERTAILNSGSSSTKHEVGKVSSAADGKKDAPMHLINNSSKSSSEKWDNSLAKSAASEADTKRARQQFAQRSRVRKIQYIAELERNVKMLQVEGSEASAELEFLNQQNLILSLENNALKKRLESLSQEKLIKYLEHEVLEKEIVRLRALYQLQHQSDPQQQTKKQGSSSHQRSKSGDLESQFTNLSLRP